MPFAAPLAARAIVLALGASLAVAGAALAETKPAADKSKTDAAAAKHAHDIDLVRALAEDHAAALRQPTRITTIRRVLLPSVRSNVATGVTLGMSRIIGDTAIVLLLAGGTPRIETQGSVPVVSLLRGTGSALTTYVYGNSPAGEGEAPQKAYAAAFVLLIFVVLLTLAVSRIGRSQTDSTGIAVAGAAV